MKIKSFAALVLKLCFMPGIVLLLVSLMPACKSNPEKPITELNPDEATGDTTLEGEKTSYYTNGKVHYIVEYHHGKANGRVREYSSDSKIYMDATFKDGHRHGKCTHFHKNGNPFEVAEYVNGVKEGVVSKYYENGKLLATIIYKNNKVQPGLREFKVDGTEITEDTELIVREVDHVAKEGKYYFEISLSKPKANVDYYASPVSDPESRQKLKSSGNAGILEIPVKSKHFVMKDMVFQAEYKTKLGNPMRLMKRYHHAVKG